MKLDAAYRDTTTMIFDYLYLVQMPSIQMTTIDYTRRYGNYTTGDKGIDDALNNQWISTMIPISKMVDYYREGTQIRVVNYNDTKLIYEAISEHLAAWKRQLEYGINIGDAPFEDLIAMDEFANAVYDHAKYQFTRDTVSSILARQMQERATISPMTFFKPGTAPIKTELSEDGIVRINPINDDGTPQPEAREGLADFFKNRTAGLRNWRP